MLLPLNFLLAFFLIVGMPLSDSHTSSFVPYSLWEPAFSKARLLEYKGDHRAAASVLLKSAPASLKAEARLLGAVLLKKAGANTQARQLLDDLVKEDGTVGELALIFREGMNTKTAVLPELWLGQKPLRGPIILSQAKGMLDGDNEDAAMALLTALLVSSGPGALRDEALKQWTQIRCSTGSSQVCLKLLGLMTFKRESFAYDAFRMRFPSEARDYSLLRSLMFNANVKSRLPRELVSNSQYSRLLEIHEMMRKKTLRGRAMEAMSNLESELTPGSPLEAALLFARARCLEMLDQDLQALDLYYELASHPQFEPVKKYLYLRMGRIALRKGLPKLARDKFAYSMRRDYPSEDISQALWESGFLSFLEADYKRALHSFTRLAEEGFLKGQAGLEFMGPRALYWKARSLEALGEKEKARLLFERLSGAFPVSFYGLAAKLLLEQSPDVEEADWESPALLLREDLPSDPEDELTLLLFRLGLYGESRDILVERLGKGTISPLGVNLLSSLLLRLGERSYYRSLQGLMPGPWDRAPRLLARILSLAFKDEIMAQVSGADPALVAAVIRFESNFSPWVESGAGAGGLMQVKRKVAERICLACKGRPMARREWKDPSLNLELGSIFLRELLGRHAMNPVLALSSYNAGPGITAQWLGRFSGLEGDEFLEMIPYVNTKAYIRRILGAYQAYVSLYFPESSSYHQKMTVRALPDNLAPYLDQPGGGCCPEKR